MAYDAYKNQKDALRAKYFWVIVFYGVRGDLIAHNMRALAFYLKQVPEETWAWPGEVSSP